MKAEQLAMFSDASSQPTITSHTGPLVWLGMCVDHHSLFDALQDDWITPPENNPGHLLGVTSFATPSAVSENRSLIQVGVRLNPRRLPPLTIFVLRQGAWRASVPDDIRADDEGVLWTEPLPTYAIAALQVSTDEERLRLVALSRQFANVILPVEVTCASFVGQRISVEYHHPVHSSGIRLTPTLNAIRGATAMASWGVPRIGPWVDLFVAVLAIGGSLHESQATELSAPWWANLPWQPDPENPGRSFDDCLWAAAISTFTERSDTEFDVREAVETIVLRASVSEKFGPDAVHWGMETLAILRGTQRLSLDSSTRSLVGIAIQLVLARRPPQRFATWRVDLPAIAPALWWTASVLCGLLSGYHSLHKDFRGDAEQRYLLTLHALWASGLVDRSSDWLLPILKPPTSRFEDGADDGRFVLSWGGTDFARKPESVRNRWLRADLSNRDTRERAISIAKKNRWPCLVRTYVLNNIECRTTGTGKLELTPRGYFANGRVRIAIPFDVPLEDDLDDDQFSRCLVSASGDTGEPGPRARPTLVHTGMASGQAGAPPPEHRAAVTSLLPKQTLVHHNVVKGLIYLPSMLTEEEEQSILSAIDSSPWLSELQRRVQHYGWRYDYKARNIDRSMRMGPLPDWAATLARRLHAEGLVPHLPDQVIVNEYVEKQGISKHIDCPPCFADGIAMVSLLESWEMIFKRPGLEKEVQTLERRSVAVMTGDSRYKWTHEIPKRISEPSGRRRRRVSVTLRKVISSASQS